MEEHLLCDSLKNKVCSAADAAKLVKDGMTIAVSGFTLSSYPKEVPLALVERVKTTGEKLKVSIYSGASTGLELDGAMAEHGLIDRRFPFITNASVRKSINSGDINFADIHLGRFPQDMMYGFFKKPDLAIVEAAGITEKGDIIPASSVGIMPQAIRLADKVIVEINTDYSMDFYGLHDIYMPKNPPNRGVIPIRHVGDRIGTPYIPCGKKKIAAIVYTDKQDAHREMKREDEVYHQMTNHIMDFLNFEVKKGRLPKNLLPIQSGVGAVANAVLAGMVDAPIENMEFFTEVIQESVMDLIDAGKVSMVSGTAISPTPSGLVRLKKEINHYKKYMVLRPQEISNHTEVIRRLGVIAINTPIECDIYGNVNSTHIMGSSMMNGLGGSGDFARDSYISIFASPSTAKGGLISTIVPMVSHVDHPEHDVKVIITEYGFADLRGLTPRERAVQIIENCAHPDYKDMLRDYFERASKEGPLQTPHILNEALSWHQRFKDTGTMKIN
ncbi:MAG: succinate CoA transferase [Bacillota bacterium]|nr:succinate CoA transferase [Bacillota bacterium]